MLNVGILWRRRRAVGETRVYSYGYRRPPEVQPLGLYRPTSLGHQHWARSLYQPRAISAPFPLPHTSYLSERRAASLWSGK
eukprot:scaffold25505_cov71-Phaeocystis_antarctica.AAC.1